MAEIKKSEDVKHSELQIEFKSQTRKYERELERFQKNRARANQTKTRERVFFILVFVLAFLAGYILFRNYKSSIRLNNKLLKQNREIEDQKELIEISNIELREQYTFTETLLNTIPNPVYYTDKNSILLGCNKAFEDISGRTSEDLVGYKIAELNVRSLLTCDTAKLFGNPGKNLVRSQGTIVYKDKKEHDVNVYRKGIVNSDAKLIGTLGIVIDVTDFKKAERDLQNSQLKLKDAINAKDKFFNIIAHDLKNPFNAILGLTSLIADHFDEHSKEDLNQFVILINQSANNVYNLLENLLEWARTQSGSIDFMPCTFAIVDIIQDSLNLFSNSLEQKQMTINFDATEYLVYADQNMIKTVFRNLLSNAIKYSYDKSTIDIILEPSGESLLIHIQDYGVGIKFENLEKIFRIEQPITTPGLNNERGTGLGLIICQEFVGKNSGVLSVSSELGNGSRFTFSLPLVM
jgi:PAS domain S-box-containing protein